MFFIDMGHLASALSLFREAQTSSSCGAFTASVASCARLALCRWLLQIVTIALGDGGGDAFVYAAGFMGHVCFGCLRRALDNGDGRDGRDDNDDDDDDGDGDGDDDDDDDDHNNHQQQQQQPPPQQQQKQQQQRR